MTEQQPTTYKCLNAEQTLLEGHRTVTGERFNFMIPEEGELGCIYYQEYKQSAQTAEAFVPPAETEPSTEDKVNRLLADYGLTREEMQAALAVKSTTKKK